MIDEVEREKKKRKKNEKLLFLGHNWPKFHIAHIVLAIVGHILARKTFFFTNQTVFPKIFLDLKKKSI